MIMGRSNPQDTQLLAVTHRSPISWKLLPNGFSERRPADMRTHPLERPERTGFARLEQKEISGP